MLSEEKKRRKLAKKEGKEGLVPNEQLILYKCYHCGGRYEGKPAFKHADAVFCQKCAVTISTCNICKEQVPLEEFNALLPIARQCKGCGITKDRLNTAQMQGFQASREILKERSKLY